MFETISLNWAGKDYFIPPHKVMGAIATIEEIVTLDELSRFAVRSTVPLAKLSMAFAAVLRYAGASAKDEEVYAEIIGSGGDTSSRTASAITALMTMMLPPASLMKGQSAGKPLPATALSGKRTRRQSAKETAKRG